MTLVVFIFGWLAMAVFLLLGLAVAAEKSSRENDGQAVPPSARMGDEPPLQPQYEPVVIR